MSEYHFSTELWLPRPLHEELSSLAKLERAGLSDYLRKTLVRKLLGERVFLNWQIAIEAVPPEWQAYESAEDR